MKMKTISKVSIYFFLIIVITFFMLPIIWFSTASIMPGELVFSDPPTIFFEPVNKAFYEAFLNPGPHLVQLFNSLTITSFAVLVNLPLSFSAAYGLSRGNLKSAPRILGWYLGLLMAPPIVFLLPYFIMISNLGLSGTKLSIVVVLQVVTIPFSIWLLKSFIDEIPFEIEEAAKIDGAGIRAILFQIVIPLCAPGIIVTTMFAFVFAWNNTVFPLILSDHNSATLQIGLLSYFSASGAIWNLIAAITVVSMVIPMLIFLVFDRYVVRGLTFGAIK